LTQQNALKEIVIAMHNYADKNTTLPAAASHGAGGRPLLSWRVLILPYIEQESLYKEFHLDEPWDSPHNLRLLPRMPKTYWSVEDQESNRAHRTHFQVFVGKGTAFDGKQGLRLPQDFPDGAANTLLVVDAAEAVLWTKPEDLPYDEARPLPALGHLPGKVFQAALADGSVRSIERSVSERTLRKAVVRDDGEEMAPEW
jgi:hypothetical protein